VSMDTLLTIGVVDDADEGGHKKKAPRIVFRTQAKLIRVF